MLRVLTNSKVCFVDLHDLLSDLYGYNVVSGNDTKSDLVVHAFSECLTPTVGTFLAQCEYEQ